MSEEELSKEEKLEAARKKFEELKKKNKKAKKKGKKAAKSEDVDGKSEIEENPANLDIPEVEKHDAKLNLEHALENESKDTQPTENDSNVSEQKDQAHSGETVHKDEINEAEDSSNAKNEVETLDFVKSEEDLVPELSNENNEIIEPKVDENRVNLDRKKNEPQNGNETSQNELSSSTEALQKQVDELSLENSSIKEELSTLKAENLELKLTKIDTDLQLDDLKNEIETHKKQIERLTLQLKAAQTGKALNQNEDNISVLSEPDYLHHGTSSFQNLASFNLNNGSQDYMDIVDVKERLQQWKGWNMDMHGWRSIGMGPVVEF